MNPIFKKIGINAANVPVLGTMVTQVTALLFMFLFAKPWPANQARTGAAKGAGFVHAVGNHRGLWIALYFLRADLGPAALLSPMWRISPLVTFALARFTLRDIEVATLCDCVAASIIVAGVFVLSRG